MKNNKRLLNANTFALLFGLTNEVYSMNAGELVDEMTFEAMLAMDVHVTTAAKNDEKLIDSMAAVFVISSDDIDRLGITTIPDALRLAPGVHVARVNTASWAVGIRGLNDGFSRFVQVLIDGRSIYDPVFGGVNWDEHGLSIEDVEHIEVVRGPGGIIWGPNAVNGVINIVRKTASQQQGLSISSSVGTEQDYSSRLDYGYSLNDNNFISFYLKGQKTKGLRGVFGTLEDDWQSYLAGVAFEHISERDHITATANYIRNDSSYIGAFFDLSIPARLDQNIQQDNHVADLQINWKRSLSETNWLNTRLSYSETHRETTLFDGHNSNADLDIEYTALTDIHQLNIGLNTQLIDSNITTEPALGLTITPESNTLSRASVYAQDRISLSNTLDIVLGARHDIYSDSKNSNQYTLRGIWRPNESTSLWIGASRAASVPNRLTVDDTQLLLTAAFLDTPLLPPEQQRFVLALETTGEVLDNTEVVACELGGRFIVNDNLSLAATFYHYDYDNILGSGFSETGTLQFNADRPGEIAGTELTLNWKMSERWMLQYSGSFIVHSDLTLSDLDQAFDAQMLALIPALQSVIDDISQVNSYENDPENLHSLRLSADVNNKLRLGFGLRYSDDIDETPVDAYTAVDFNLDYQLTEQLQFGFTARNLFADDHIEFSRVVLGSERVPVPTSVALNLVWRQ